ncbi:unnamed protein product, partial [Tilletia caries]
MTLVAALSSFFGLGRQAAGLLLVFFATVISPLLATPGSTPPRQLATVRKQLGLVPHLVHYAVCPACERLSLVADASEECQACGEILYERAGKPVILFVYQTLTSWLSWLLQQPGIEAALQEWRDEPPSTTMRDVYDGAAWQSERDVNGRPFTDHTLSLLTALGIDWFSPFRSQYTSWHSTGAIMMTILNLPQRLRYMQASTYLSGCTPGPKEPSATRVGQYVQPLMEELAEFVDGKIIPTSTAPNGRKVRLRVAFFCGDSVGRNKICGFPPHSVRKGDFCGFCPVTFSTRISAFDEPLPSRDPRQHKRDSVRCSQPFTSKAAQTRHERRTGARASALNDLPYWNSVSRSPVDAMHCIELGVVKRLFHRTYIEGTTITPQQLLVVQSLLRNSQIPASEEAPDHRLGDPGGGSATAAQWSTLGRRILVLALYLAWKNEIDSNETIFFVHPEPVKKNKKRKKRGRNHPTAGGEVKDEADDPNLVDPEDDAHEVEEGDDPDDEVINAPDPASVPRAVLNAREVLINTAELAAAATLTARHSINADEISDLDDFLRSFGAGQAALYGPKWVVYNTHIATHVPEHIKRFGPAWHFSAYHFERMNGQLSNTGTNRHRNGEIESSYTNAFCTRGRFEMFLSRNESLAEAASLADRIPPIKLDIPSRLDSRSVLGREGNVSVVMSVG